MGDRSSGVAVRGLLLAIAFALVVALTAWLTAAQVRDGAHEAPVEPPRPAKSSEVRLLLVVDGLASAGAPEPVVLALGHDARRAGAAGGGFPGGPEARISRPEEIGSRHQLA